MKGIIAIGKELFDEERIKELLQLNKRLFSALLELHDLKTMKDAEGKTPEYLERQPYAWLAAADALRAAQSVEKP